MTGGTALFLQNRAFLGALIVQMPLAHALRQREHGTPLVVYSPFEQGRLLASVGLAEETRIWARAVPPQTDPASIVRPGLAALVRELRARRYERIVTLRPQSAGVTLALWASGAAERIGHATFLGRLALTRTAPRDTSVYRAIDALGLLGIEDPEAALSDSMRALARRASGAGAAPSGAYCLMPCGSETRKLWGDANFVSLAREIAATDREARFLLVIGPGEQRFVDLFEQAGLGARTRALVGAPLPEIARAVLVAKVVVANDCGPAHVAQIAGAPIVSIFGNWDGRAQVRIAEWFHPRRGARCVTPASQAPIHTIGVGTVRAEIERVVADPRGAGGIVQAPLAAATA